MVTKRLIRRGTHRSTDELEIAICSNLASNNRDPKPFALIKRDDPILEGIKRILNATF